MLSRKKFLDFLQEKQKVDLVVIGGGATGLGVGLDACLRGLSVALFESQDYAGGTSSRSTKLFHGGVRYLKNLSHWPLLKEALKERKILLELAPHIAQPIPFIIPTSRPWVSLYYRAGLGVYDSLAKNYSLGKTEIIPNQRSLMHHIPGIKLDKFSSGVLYWDAKFDDARYALSLAQTIAQNGGQIGNYLKVTHIQVDPHSPYKYLVVVEDSFDKTKQYTIQTRAVVNATGVWSQETLSFMGGGQPEHSMLTISRGIHIVLPHFFADTHKAIIIPQTADGRVFFAIPWLNETLLIGTTDTVQREVVREPTPSGAEVAYLLAEASKVFQRPISLDDIKSCWAGLRPLVHKPHIESKNLSREHHIYVNSQGILTVIGGKWTTYRKMAEDVMQILQDHKILPQLVPSKTASTPLYQAPKQRSIQQDISGYPNPLMFGLDHEIIKEELFGDAKSILNRLQEAYIRFSLTHEGAVTVEDMLSRRYRYLMTEPEIAQQLAPEVAKIMYQETGIDPKLNDFLELCDKYLSLSRQ
ncbi:MAG: glycerol-3-phosphate dehydrogenase/oxidase [Gammaproteobacteria bacterium]|nr:glycerol-3-phosphate dehydrogenase/oxidase [Gammaproteobacteria bacterium]